MTSMKLVSPSHLEPIDWEQGFEDPSEHVADKWPTKYGLLLLDRPFCTITVVKHG
jgi:hypothetical protein